MDRFGAGDVLAFNWNLVPATGLGDSFGWLARNSFFFWNGKGKQTTKSSRRSQHPVRVVSGLVTV